MIPFLLFVLLGAFASASEQVQVRRNYHRDVGIPLAQKIRIAEEALFNNPTKNQDRIIGGVISTPNSHPAFGALLINFVNIAGTSVCGSTLLTPNRLVTAAHCWFDGTFQASLFTVVLGTNNLFFGGQRIPTNTVIMHPQWNPMNLNNDVAMIYMPVSVAYTTAIQPMALPNFSQLSESFVGEWAVAAGFGATSDQQVGASLIMSEVTLQVISVAQCALSYGNVYVQPSTLCTSGIGGVGVCGGDSGGPLYINRNGQRILVGVSSFAADQQCERGHPSGFARVTSFYNFIVSHLF